MTILGNIAHILVFPFPAQGHMIPLLDLSHQLATHGLTITILITPKNLPLLNPLLSKHPSIKTLVLPFPAHSSIPDGVENCKDLHSNSSVVIMMHALGELYNPLLDWFHNHPSPPVAIISDMFLGWTHKLACEIGIRPIVFSPSGALALSVIFALWRDMPRLNHVRDRNQLVKFPKIPNSPKYPLWQVSPMYRSYVEGDPISEFIKDGFLGDIGSWGLVINSFTELERVYLDHLAKQMDSRVWAVGPLLPSAEETTERGGSSSVSGEYIISWLDTCQDQKVVYVCFGSQSVLTNDQMDKLALGLEKRIAAGVAMLAWPMGADQFVNAGLLVDELKVAKLVCEGAKTVPDSTELARVVAESVSSENRVMELREEAIKAIEKSGTSVKDLEGLIKHLAGLELEKENNLIIEM
ncbi:hypothetical protein QYF36_021708 [Acer negundo]|nr:hypothetical protein QYF36_021708 [Acer negundo]